MALKLKSANSSAQFIAGIGKDNTAEIVALRVNDVMPDPLQPRKSLQAIDGEVASEDRDALESLADDMHQKGQLQPIVVKEVQGGRFQIIMGERRWRAAKLNQERYGDSAGTVQAVVRNELADENLRLAQLSENLQRVNLTDLETATFLKNILEEYPALKKQTLASILGKNPQYVSRILALVDPKWSHVVDTGIITYASLLEQFRTLPEEAQNALIEDSKKRGEALTSGDINKARAKTKQKPEAANDVAAANKDAEWPFAEPTSRKAITPQSLHEVTSFLDADVQQAGDSYQYTGKVEEIAPATQRIADFGGDATIPTGIEAFNPNLFDKREVKLSIGQLKALLAKDAFADADFVVTAMLPVPTLKNAIESIGGETPQDDNQLVISLIKQLNKVTQ